MTSSDATLVADYLAQGGRILVCPAHHAAGALRLVGRINHVSFQGGRASRKPSLEQLDRDNRDDDEADTPRQRAPAITNDKQTHINLRPLANAHAKRSARWLCESLDFPRYVWRAVLAHIATGRTPALGFLVTYANARREALARHLFH